MPYNFFMVHTARGGPRHIGIFGPEVKFQPLTQDAKIIDPYSRDLLQISAMSHQQLVALVGA